MPTDADPLQPDSAPRWTPVPIPKGDGRHDIGDDTRAAIVERLTSDWSRDPDLTPEKARQLAMWAAASVRSLFNEIGTLKDMQSEVQPPAAAPQEKLNEEVKVSAETRAILKQALAASEAAGPAVVSPNAAREYLAMPHQPAIAVRAYANDGRRVTDFIALEVSPGLNAVDCAVRIADALSARDITTRHENRRPDGDGHDQQSTASPKVLPATTGEGKSDGARVVQQDCAGAGSEPADSRSPLQPAAAAPPIDLLAEFDVSVQGMHLLNSPRPNYDNYDKAEWHTRGIMQGLKIARTILEEILLARLRALQGSEQA